MRVGLIGDTQGRYNVRELAEKVRAHFANVDEIWHLGDWQWDEALQAIRDIGPPVQIVNGNAPDDPRYETNIVLEREGLRIGLVHRPPIPSDPWLSGLSIVIHGHTHLWRDEVIGTVRFLNVGTATGAWPASEASIGILTLEDGGAELERIDL